MPAYGRAKTYLTWKTRNTGSREVLGGRLVAGSRVVPERHAISDAATVPLNMQTVVRSPEIAGRAFGSKPRILVMMDLLVRSLMFWKVKSWQSIPLSFSHYFLS